MNSGLITTQSKANEIYAKISDPLAFVQAMGKTFHQSQIMGVNTPGDGEVLALTCMCEGITPLEFAKTYHIINGRPSMRADMMAAKFRSNGGKIEWKNPGDDGKLAEAIFTWEGQSMPVKYTIEDARAAVGDKIDKTDSNWKKDRGAMLRARVITKAVRMLAPELIAGLYTPEEIEDYTSVAKPAAKSESEIAARRAELLGRQSVVTETIQEATSEPAKENAPVVDEVPLSAATAKAEQGEMLVEGNAESPLPPDNPDGPCTMEQLHELVGVFSKIPSQDDPSRPFSLIEIRNNACKAANVAQIEQATFKQIAKLIEQGRAALSKIAAAGNA